MVISHGGIALRLIGAASPIFAPRLADGPCDVVGQALEIDQRAVGIAQIAQRNEAREELLVHILVAYRHLAMVGKLKRKLGVAISQRITRLDRHLVPPALGMIAGKASGVDAQ